MSTGRTQGDQLVNIAQSIPGTRIKARFALKILNLIDKNMSTIDAQTYHRNVEARVRIPVTDSSAKR